MLRRTTYTILFVTLLADLYIWLCHLQPFVAWWLSCLWWLPSLLFLAAAYEFYVRRHYRQWIIRFLFGHLLCLSLPKACFAVVAPLLGWQAGLVIGLAVIALAVYGFVCGPRRLKVRHATVSWPSLPPSFSGYRIVHLSDLHLGTLGRHSRLVDRIVEAVNAEGADLVVFTGDIVNRDASELSPYIYNLGCMQARDGVYAVFGNHDFVADVNELSRQLQQAGWHLLRNRCVTLQREGGHITLVGVDNVSQWVFASYGNLSAAMQDTEGGTFQVLLSHDPSHWRKEVLDTTDIQLMLSGHTHAGQLRIGRWSLARLFAHEHWGWYAEGDRRLHVSAGISGTFPFRLGAWPEVTVITISKASPVPPPKEGDTRCDEWLRLRARNRTRALNTEH